MAGNHRAEPTKPASRSSRRTVAIAAVIALLPALWFGSQRLLDSDPDSTSPTGNPTVTNTPIPADPTAVATPTKPATTPKPTDSPVSLPKVAADVPRRLTVKGLLDVGFDDSIEPKNGSFTAGSTAEAARWGSRGRPASPGKDTVYLIGKVYKKGASAFDDLTKVDVGTKITLRTDNGRLTYTVKATSTQSASGLTDDVAFAAKVPDRLVLVGILYGAGDNDRTGKVLVVTAELTGATKG